MKLIEQMKKAKALFESKKVLTEGWYEITGCDYTAPNGKSYVLRANTLGGEHEEEFYFQVFDKNDVLMRDHDIWLGYDRDKAIEHFEKLVQFVKSHEKKPKVVKKAK